MQLRPMTMDDAYKMLGWKNYPETRKFAIASHDEIKIDDHIKYIKRNLQYFQIIEGSLEVPTPFGAVRIKDNELSIWIDRSYWGKGVASYVIDMVSKKGMTAKIVEGNVASMRAFINADFKPISHQDGYYIFKR